MEAGDGPGLYRTFMAAIMESATPFYSREQIGAWTSHISREILEARMLSTVAFAAVASSSVVGFVSFDPGHFELDFLYVHPSVTRRGIGRRLARKVEEEALRRGFERIELTASLNAVAVYEKLGYRRLHDMVKTLDGVKVPCVRMSLSLSTGAGK